MVVDVRLVVIHFNFVLPIFNSFELLFNALFAPLDNSCNIINSLVKSEGEVFASEFLLSELYSLKDFDLVWNERRKRETLGSIKKLCKNVLIKVVFLLVFAP